MPAMLTESFGIYQVNDAGQWLLVARRKGLQRAWALCRKLAKANPGTEYRIN